MDCLLNVMGFNGDNACQNHHGIQNIHTLSSTYNGSWGDNSKPPKMMDTIFDSMLHDKDRYRPEQQIQMAQDIWLTGLDKPLWAKTLDARATTTTSQLLNGVMTTTRKKIKGYLDKLIIAWNEAVRATASTSGKSWSTLWQVYSSCYHALQNDMLSETNKSIRDFMNTIAQQAFPKSNSSTCWKIYSNFCLFRTDTGILQHIKEVVIPILCLITGEEKYDVFFGCYNDYPNFQKMIEQKFHKPLRPKNQQNNQPLGTNNQNNGINNIYNNTNIINNNTSTKQQFFINDIQSNINITKNDNTFQCPQCIPQCCVNLCAKICPNHIQQSPSLDN